MRDNFSAAVKKLLASRVNYRCSNPTCGRPTSGPADRSDRAISIGEAAHITAASPGGARYEASLDGEQRCSAVNGIWLCSVCAKLIDSDVDRFPVAVIEEWKTLAERNARLGIEVFAVDQKGSGHSIVPVLRGLTYHAARKQLLLTGWQPIENPPSHVDSFGSYVGNAKEFWEIGYRELENVATTGMGFCLFKLRDMYLNVLHVVTSGEEDRANDRSALVLSWWIEPPTAEEPKPTRPLIAINKAPANVLEHLGPGTPQERVKEVLGHPHRKLYDAWGYRFDDALIQIAYDNNECVRYIALAVTNATNSDGFLVPWLHSAIGHVTLADVKADEGDLEYRSSLRTEEIIWWARLGPPGAWKYVTLGALWPLTPGCLPEPGFVWSHEHSTLESDPKKLTFNWVGISHRAEEILFEWTLAL